MLERSASRSARPDLD